MSMTEEEIKEEKKIYLGQPGLYRETMSGEIKNQNQNQNKHTKTKNQKIMNSRKYNNKKLYKPLEPKLFL